MSRHPAPRALISSRSSDFRQEISGSALRQPLLAFFLAALLLTLSVASSLAGNELAAAGAGPALPSATFLVNDPGDAADADTADGLCDVDLVTPDLQCTLRAAIQEANAQPGLDTINFDLPPDSLTIQPASPLPDISEAAIVDASTEPGPERSEATIVDGSAQPSATCLTPTVRIDGALTGASTDGLTISSGGSTVRGLIITGFPDAGLLLIGGAGNTVTCNLIGTDAAGSTGLGNGGNGIDVFQSDGNIIGGSEATEGNIIAGNGLNGVKINLADNNSVLGNTIGLDPTGSVALPNGGSGVAVVNSIDTTIGGTIAGAGNLISGNGAAGIYLGSSDGSMSSPSLVQGNRIGTDTTGFSAVPNQDGIAISDSTGNTIGGSAAGARNLISGNTQVGIRVDDGSDNTIHGNWIGVDATGVAALPNNTGILITSSYQYGSGSFSVGGGAAGEANVVSGNSGPGISVTRRVGGSVSGNLVGVGADGLTALGNGSHGITLSESSTGIGGLGAGNVIAGNGGYGIALDGDLYFSPWSHVYVFGNAIGAAADGSPLHPNTLGGVLLNDLPGQVEDNVIVGNGGNGITVLGGSDARVGLQRNEVADNAALGIDLAGDGVTPNDPGDGDFGPNLSQNFPVVTAATGTGGATEVDVSFDGLPNAAITVELFHSPTCDPSGYGEGAHYLGEITLNTDASGLAVGTAVIAQAAPPGHFVTATATFYVGMTNFVTSEFSACVVVQAPVVTCTPGPHSGTIGADETWCASDSPHVLSGDVLVAPGVVLTIEPGVVVKGNTDVELKVQGQLAAQGTLAQPILFTSSTDIGPNQWSGLIFDGGTGDLNYATVRYGGNRSTINPNCSNSGLGFNIAVRNVLAGEVRLQNSQVLSEHYLCNGWQNADYGLYVDNSHVTIDNTLFQSNGNASDDYPLYAFGANSVVTLTNSVFTANARPRVLFGASVLSTWDATLAPQAGLEGYELGGDINIPAGHTWTVQPGAMLLGRDSVEIQVQGHLAAIGTPAQPITFTSSTNTGTAQWSGLVFDGGTGDLRHATVRYGGDPNSINPNCSGSGLGFNVAVRNVLAGEVRLENSKVLSERFNCNGWQTDDYGLYVDNSRVVVNDTLFQGNGNDGSDYPIYVQGANSTLALNGNTFSANPRNRVLLAAGALTAANVQLMDEQGLESYELAADYVVPLGITLTVDPGVTVMGRGNVELRTLGHLAAIGTPMQPITFTSATNTGADQWSGLIFDGGTGDLQHATVRYGGNVNSINPNCSGSGLGFNVAVRNVQVGEVRLENSKVLSERFNCNGWQTEDYGLYVDNSRVVVSDTLFQGIGNDGSDYPIYVQGANSTLALNGNTFSANPRNRVLLAAGALTAANVQLMDEQGLESYELAADYVVPLGITLTLDPDVTVMGRGNVELRTLGHLAAIGTPTQPITFTSSTNTGPYQWSGLIFDGGTGDLQHATVRYGGNVNSINGNCSTSGMGFNVAVHNVLAGEVRLENSKVLSERFSCNNWTASDYGLYVNNGRVTVNNTLFANNGNTSNDYAVYATGASSVLTFDGNVLRNNVRGLQLNGVASQILRNNAVIDNQQGGINIGSGTNAQMLHTTVARNGGDGITVASGGSASLVNTILTENVTGLRVTAGGVATLSQTLWDDNGTNTVGAVNQTGSLTGLAVFDDDGYHLTRYSTAIEQGVDAGVLTDVDGQARPQPAGASPDLGADEYIYGFGEEFIFEKIALPLQWTVAPPPQGGIPSGSLTQRYLLRYYYGSSDPNPPALTVTLTDTLPAALTLENQDHYPAMSFQQAGQTLSWQTLQPVTRGQAGQIEIDTRYDNPQPSDVLTNTAALHAGSAYLSDLAVTQVPLFAPVLVAPGNGETCAGQVEIRGLAQPGVTVNLLVDNTPVFQVQADASGHFSASYSYDGSATKTLTAQACTPGGACSAVSQTATLRPPQSFWCPQRSTWEGTPTVGPQAGHHLVFNFRNSTGEYSSQNWRIPGVYGFWNTMLSLHACNCPPASGTTAPPSTVWLIADGVRYDPTGSHPDYTFAVTGAAHNVVFWADCGGNYVSSTGKILIDPDGYVFDVTQGFNPLDPTAHAIPGVTVTLYVNSEEWGGWTPWPAHEYNNQVNPQVTGVDGYFAFFTPPGQYYLQVDGKPGYQPWRSPLIEVVNEIVHVNVPYTPWTEPPVVETVTEVLLTASGPQPASITVASGTTVQWRAEIDGLAQPAELAELAENPVLQPLSTLNPISTTLGWDGGMLKPGQIYQRQLTQPGTYTYSDGLGHQGQVCVDACTPLAVTLASFEATAQPGAIQVTWETVSEIDNATFNLYRGESDDFGSAVLLATVPSQAPGSPQGYAYSYDDTAVQLGQTAWYWLETIDLSGGATLHGPASAIMQVPTAVTLTTFESTPVNAGPGMPLIMPLLALAAWLVLRIRSRVKTDR